MSNLAPLFADRSATVDVQARRVPTVVCVCGREAPRVMAGAGLDLHECSRLHYTARWHCCGLVAASPGATATYRVEAICPRCGVDRFGVAAAVAPLDRTAWIVRGVDGPEDHE